MSFTFLVTFVTLSEGHAVENGIQLEGLLVPYLKEKWFERVWTESQC